MKISNILMYGMVAVGLAACGGGGGGGGTVQQTTAILKLSTVAKAGQTPAAKGLAITLLMPQGVTVKTVTGTKQTTADVVRFSGNSAFSNVTSQLRPLLGNYSAGKAPGKNGVKITFASGSATFGPGEFATVTCDIAPGATATTADFQLTGFLAGGAGGADITASFDAPTFSLDVR